MMNQITNNLYRILVPKPIRNKVLLTNLKRNITNYLESLPSVEFTVEKQLVLEYITKFGVAIFPYEYTHKYKKSDIIVHLDAENGFKYVMHEEKRLYFKKRWSISRIKRSYNQLIMEQDAKSPHCYLTEKFNVNENEVVADFGAAEGNFSLSIIERVKHIYLFEADYEWIDALNLTFKPWKDKITIVPKFVSNCNDEKHCSGDFYFKDKEISFLKIDVEGSERSLLEGLSSIISNAKPLKIALCTYHKNDDELEFTDLLNNRGYNVEPSSGYIIFYYDKNMKYPYLRRALIRAYKD